MAVRYRNEAARAAKTAHLKQVARDQVWLAVLNGRPPMARPGTSVVGGYVALADALADRGATRGADVVGWHRSAGDGRAADLSGFSSIGMYGVGQTEPPPSTPEVADWLGAGRPGSLCKGLGRWRSPLRAIARRRRRHESAPGHCAGRRDVSASGPGSPLRTPSIVTGLTAQQASDLLTGHRRSVRRTLTGCWDDMLHTRLARRRARRRYWVAVTERTAAAVERARSNLAATPAVRRPYGRIGAFLVTALLMLASFFTISSILASADLPPLEAWLLPLAFGPVFVLATKTAVSAWLSSAPPIACHRRLNG